MNFTIAMWPVGDGYSSDGLTALFVLGVVVMLVMTAFVAIKESAGAIWRWMKPKGRVVAGILLGLVVGGWLLNAAIEHMRMNRIMAEVRRQAMESYVSPQLDHQKVEALANDYLESSRREAEWQGLMARLDAQKKAIEVSLAALPKQIPLQEVKIAPLPPKQLTEEERVEIYNQTFDREIEKFRAKHPDFFVVGSPLNQSYDRQLNRATVAKEAFLDDPKKAADTLFYRAYFSLHPSAADEGADLQALEIRVKNLELGSDR